MSNNKNIYESGEYWNNNTALHEEGAEFKVTNALKLIHKHGLKPTSIVDCGCGSGRNSYLFSQKTGAKTVGIDVSGDAIDHAKMVYQNENLSFEKLQISNFPERASLGIMFDVFEHVEDYFGFLRQARDKADYWVFNIPLDMNVLTVIRSAHMNAREQVGHIHYFSEETAIATLQDCGYQVVDYALESAVLQALRTKPSFKGFLAAIPRMVLFRVSPSFAVRLLGGACLVALCKTPSKNQ